MFHGDGPASLLLFPTLFTQIPAVVILLTIASGRNVHAFTGPLYELRVSLCADLAGLVV